ncbi:MAG: DUF3793 family protein [Oscillospiraceae bacterium]|nr:DUF3793 family protein [Oscillospiraceae bacterium]
MSEEMIIRHCSPTLAGLKTGSLFSCACSSREELTQSLRRINRKLVPKGLRVIPLRIRGERALIYVYRLSDLKRDLNNQQARELLEENGYLSEKVEQCLMRLIRRVKMGEEFPHEIGLFLSYPPEDVNGFIHNKACKHKCVGCWKVYGDETAAQKTFARYEKCTRVYCSQWEKGRSIERLTVAG